MKKLKFNENFSLKDCELLKEEKRKILGGYTPRTGEKGVGGFGQTFSGSYTTNTAKDSSICMTTGQGASIRSWSPDSTGYTTNNGNRYTLEGKNSSGKNVYNQTTPSKK